MSLLGGILGLGGIQASSTTSGTANPDGWLVDIFSGIATSTGLRVSIKDAMTVPAISACIQVLSEDLAKIPLILYKRTRGGGRERATNHPLYKILKEKPAPWLSSFMLRRSLIEQACKRGNGYARIHRDAYSRVSHIQPLPAGAVSMKWASDGEPFFDVTIGGRVEHGLSFREILHVPYRATSDESSNGGIFGISPITMHKEAIALAIATERFGAKYFANGARPSAVVEMDGKFSDDQVAARFRTDMERIYSGVDNAGRIAILELGMKLREISSNNNDSQLAEIKEQQSEEMARMYRIPPPKIGLLRRSTFSNIEHLAIEYVTDAVSPLASAVEQQASLSLLTEAEQEDHFIEFHLDGLLRGDIESRYRAYAIGRQWGWLNVDKICEVENINAPPNGAGQEYLRPMNMGTAGSEDKQGIQQ